MPQDSDSDDSNISIASSDATLPLTNHDITDLVTVFLGVDANDELKSAGKSCDLANAGGNFIKIQVKNPNAHILQFVVRQALNANIMFPSNPHDRRTRNNVPFRKKNLYYMESLDNPCWIVDKTEGNSDPFYDTDPNAMVIKTADSISIYDRPTVVGEEERVLFCTFIVIDSKVHCTIKWSRQESRLGTFVKEKRQDGVQISREVFYSIEKDYENLSHIPLWAKKAICDDARFKLFVNSTENHAFLIENPQEIPLREACEYMIAPDPQWIFMYKYPGFFERVKQLTLMAGPSEEELKKHSGPGQTP